MKKISYMLKKLRDLCVLPGSYRGFGGGRNGYAKSVLRDDLLSRVVPGAGAFTCGLLLLIGFQTAPVCAATQNSGDQGYSNNADGFSLAGGTTTVRTLTVTGGDVTLTGSVSSGYTYNFPTPYSGTTATLVGVDETQTLTHKTWNGEVITVPYGGTGAATLTGLLLGNGTSAVTGITTSAGVSGALSDETGSGVLVFGTAPTFTTSITAPLLIGGTGTASTLILRPTSGAGTTGADIIFQNGNNGATERMRILNSGNVGIGSSAPQQKLDVEGTIYVGSSGNIGIGTSTPGAGLQVGTGTKSLSATLGNTSALIKGNLEVDGKIYGDGSTLTGVAMTTALTQNYVTKMGSAALSNSQIMDNGTNVGIGSSTPQQKLDVEGTVYLGSGNLGIGDSTPDALLDLLSSSAANTYIKITNTNAGDYDPAIQFELAEGTATFTMGVDDSDSDKFKISTTALGTNDRLVINSSGNIGIGSSTPQQKLDVEGTVYFGTGNVGIGTASPYTKLQVVDTSAASPRGILSSQISSDTNGARVGFSKARGVPGTLTTVVTGDTIGRLMFRGYDGSNYLEMASIEAITTGTIAATRVPTYLAFSTGTDAAPSVLTERLRIDAAGNVGVGDTSPDSLFDMLSSSAANTYIKITNSNAGDYDSAIQFELTEGTPSFTMGVDDSDSDKFKISTTALGTNDRLVITSAGNVGISSSTPQQRLDVEGTIYVGSSGNIGIGTSTPGAGLQVGTGTKSLSATLDGSAALIKGNLEVDGKIYGDGSGLTGVVGSISGLTTNYVAKAATSTTLSNSQLFDNGTNVGIGSTDPGAKLQIAQSADSSGLKINGYDDQSAAYIAAGVNPSGAGFVDSGSSLALMINNDARVSLSATAFYPNGVTARSLGTTTYPWSEFYSKNISDDGTNVGIGSSTPQQKLDVEGTVYFGTGNVGIGTASPYTKLQVVDTSAASPRGILSSQVSSDTNGARVGFSKARGTPGTLATVVTGDTIGRLMFRGYDGSNYLEMASIEAVTTGTIAATRVPTYLAFSTGTDAAPSVLTERLRIDAAGNVGIGDTSPDALFDMLSSSAADMYFKMTNTNGGDYDAAVQFELTEGTPSFTMGVDDSDSDKFKISTTALGTNDRLIIDSNGNLGVGDASPDSLFDMLSSSAANTYIKITNSNAGDYDPAIQFELAEGTATFTMGVDDSDSDKFKISTTALGTSDRLVINSSGNVGISSSTPQQRLDVEGTVYLGSGNLGVGDSTPDSLLDMLSSSAANTYIKVTNTNGGDYDPAIQFELAEGTATFTMGVDDSDSDKFKISTTALGTNDRLVIDSAGNVGIGSATPTALVDVNGVIYSHGNVGIGTWLPTLAGLQVGRGTAAQSAGLNRSGALIKGNLEVDGRIYGDGAGLTNISGISGWTVSSTNVYKTLTGNVGIGSTTPQGSLEIALNSGVAPLMVSSTVNGDLLVVASGGNVGIGSASPSVKLYVNGGAVIKGSSTAGTIEGEMVYDSGGHYYKYYNGSTWEQFVGGSVTYSGTLWDQNGTTIYYYAGNVGIGTNAPGQLLDLWQMEDGNGLRIRGKTDPGSYCDLFVTSGGDVYYEANSETSFRISSTTNFLISSSLFTHSVNARLLDNVALLAGTDSDYALGYNSADDTFRIADGSNLTGSPRLVMDANGNIGLGADTGPDATLEVAVVSGRTPLMVSNGASGDGDYVVVTSAGNVGIGSTSPNRKVEIVGGSSGAETYLLQLRANATAANTGSTIKFINSSSGSVDNGSGELAVIRTLTNAGDMVFRVASDTPTMTERMRILSTGNVGIGDSSPDSLLDLLSSSGANTYIKITNTNGGDYDPAVQFELAEGTATFTLGVDDSDSDKFKISTTALGTNDRLIINSSGNLGVGDASPDSLLDMLSTSAADTYFKITNTNAGDYDSAIQFELTEGTPSFTMGVDDSDSDKFKISTTALGTSDRLVITSAGNVGISSSAPQQRLDVEGTIYVGSSGNIGIGTSTPGAGLQVGTGTKSLSATLDGSAALIKGNLEVDGKIYGDGSGLTGVVGSVSGLTANYIAKSSTATTLTNSQIFDNGTNVGIGSGSPQAKLDVEGGVYFGNGNVGIGAPGTGGKLQVRNVNGGSGILYLENSASADVSVFYDWGGSLNYFYGDTENVVSYETATITTGSMLRAVQNASAFSGTGLLMNFADGSGSFTGKFIDLQNDSTSQFVVMNNGNVGIGSATPQQKLDVEGTVYFGTGNVGIGSATPTALLDVSGIIHSSGNVGVGTYLPAAGLQVGPGAKSLTATLGTTSVLIKGNLEVDGKLYGDGSGLTGVVGSISGLTTNYVAKASSSTTLMNSQIFDNGTNVGIGSSSPQAKLDVEGMVYFGNGNVGIGTANPAYKIFVLRDANDPNPLAVLENGTNGTDAAAYLGLRSATSELDFGSFPANFAYGGMTHFADRVAMFSRGMGDAYDAAGLDLVAMAGTADMRFYTGGVTTANERMRIAAAGNVGIGSTVPQQRLDVEGTVYIGTGNLGVGDATPDSLLDMLSTSAANTYFKITNTNAGDYDPAIQFELAEGTATFTMGVDDSDSDKFKISTTALGTNDRLIINSSGNVGIGSATPTALLDVNGIIYSYGNVGVGTYQPAAGLQVGAGAKSLTTSALGTTSALIKGNLEVDGKIYGDGSSLTGLVADSPWDGTAGSSVYYNSGNVGIGSASPQQKLDVEGTVYFGTGRVGIGIASPTADLELRTKATTNNGMYIDASTVTTGSGLRIEVDGTTMDGGDPLLVTRDGSTVFSVNEWGGITTGSISAEGAGSTSYILTDGIGIGDQYPDAKFEVSADGAGSGSVMMLSSDDNLDGNLMTVTVGGNVGIGSSSPQQKLDVEGTVYFGTGNVGVGVAAPNSKLQLNGSFAVYRTSSTGGTTAGQVIIGVDSSGGAHTITLATADCVAGRIMIIKDETGDAGTNNITIATQGSQAIDGTTDDSSVVITSNYGVVRLYSNGTDWFTF